jgi:CubicO group peptidase (beta-lactamase class C family)
VARLLPGLDVREAKPVSDLDAILLRRRVDRLVEPWEAPGTPGIAIGVVRDGALVLHRCAGLASLELGVPVGPGTCFRIASVSKQFTCAAIHLLAAEGRLDIEAEARSILGELPDFGVPVTIAHLMHNTSGIRDMLEIMRQGGVDLGHPIAQEDLLAGICRQRTLNFAPGSRYLYSNTGFLLLGLIVERISGEALPAFLERRIFAPLGMNRTRMTPSLQEPAPGLATGYLPKQGRWVRAPHAFPMGGEGGLVSCVEDLALWERNFTTHRVGGAALAEALETQIEFTGGGRNSYACGLRASTHRGVRTLSHGGLWPGYKTEFLRAPEQGIAVICISNHGGCDPYHLARDILDVMLDPLPGTRPVPRLPPRETLEAMAGRWLDRDSGMTLDIGLDEAGRPIGTTHGVPFRLQPAWDGRLEASSAAADLFCAPAAGGTLAVELDAGVRATYHWVAPGAALPEGLAGAYANAEIGATWTIAPSKEGLEVRVRGPVANNGGPWPVEAVAGDDIRIWIPGTLFKGWLDVRALRTGGRIAGLSVTGNRARRLIYQRQPEAA